MGLSLLPPLSASIRTIITYHPSSLFYIVAQHLQRANPPVSNRQHNPTQSSTMFSCLQAAASRKCPCPTCQCRLPRWTPQCHAAWNDHVVNLDGPRHVNAHRHELWNNNDLVCHLERRRSWRRLFDHDH